MTETQWILIEREIAYAEGAQTTVMLLPSLLRELLTLAREGAKAAEEMQTAKLAEQAETIREYKWAMDTAVGALNAVR